MSKKIGIQLTNELELAVSNGSLVVGDTLYQHQYLILQAQKGEFKENPTLGVGINDMANDDGLNEWKKSIREEFAKDGMKVNELNISTTGIELKADY
jgi:hypothetical protein